MNKDIIKYINEVNPSHTDICIWGSWKPLPVNEDSYTSYNYTIDDNIMRLSDDGRVLKSDLDKWIINKRDKQIDKILL